MSTDAHVPRRTAASGSGCAATRLGRGPRAPVVAGAAVRLAAARAYAYPCGDHTLFVGHVRALEVQQPDAVRPLLFYCGKYGAISPSAWSEEAAPSRLWPEMDGQWW